MKVSKGLKVSPLARVVRLRPSAGDDGRNGVAPMRGSAWRGAGPCGPEGESRPHGSGRDRRGGRPRSGGDQCLAIADGGHTVGCLHGVSSFVAASTATILVPSTGIASIAHDVRKERASRQERTPTKKPLG